jgi:tetratricopeptide (TPR) repeat protein
VSSARITSISFALFLLTSLLLSAAQTQTGSPASENARGTAGSNAFQNAAPQDPTQKDPAQIFQRGQDALNQGQLDEAEKDFHSVLALDAHSGAAYANLGVVYMRRKQWSKALDMFHKAAPLLPGVAGIQLNIGLAYYRQNEFLQAIPPFESVVRDQPEAPQPRYLLGLCYFFSNRWSDAARTLEPLWSQESPHFPYLYVLSNAAHRAGMKDLDDRASAQLIKLADGSPEYHLFAGKYYLNQGQFDPALQEFQAAARANPKLAFIHFNMGLAYVKKQDYEHARAEFLQDATIEPDLALNYDQLGDLDWLAQDDAGAEKNYREALQRDPRLVNSRLGLAKIYQRAQKFSLALREVDAAEKIDPDRPDVHYVRGQVLSRLGRKDEGKKELEAARQIEQKQAASPNVPSPELLDDSR